MLEMIEKLQNQITYEDEFDNSCQASPRFYVIKDLKFIKDESGEDYLCFSDNGDIISPQEYVDHVFTSFDYTMEATEELEEIQRVTPFSADALYEWSCKHDTSEVDVVTLSREPFIVENTLFLTKADALEHLKLNRHRYSPDAFVYAMTAFRSPAVEAVIEFIKTVDLSKLKKEVETHAL